MNKLLIVLLIPWCLLISCSEPKNGGRRSVVMPSEASGERSNFLGGFDSPRQKQQVIPAVPPPTNNEGRVIAEGLTRETFPIARPSSKLYGGYSFDELIGALYAIESSKGVNKRGRYGEMGSYQFTRLTWSFVTRKLLRKRWSRQKAYNDYYAEIAARAYLKYLIKRFTRRRTDKNFESWELAMLAWNEGASRVSRGRTRTKGFFFLYKIKKYLRTGKY